MNVRSPIPYGRHVVKAICAYELVAMHSPLPTITCIVHRYRKCRTCWVVLVVLFAWLAHHLFIEES